MPLSEVGGKGFLLPVNLALLRLIKHKGVIKKQPPEHAANHGGTFPLRETEFLSFCCAHSTLKGVMQ